MKKLLCACAVLPLLFTSCSSPEMEAVAQRIQKTRVDNALHAKSARIRVWRDTSTHDKHGWHIHSEQESKYTLPENEFRTARYLVATQGYTTWHRNGSPAVPSLSVPAQPYIVELEWLNASHRPIGSINLPAIYRESELGGLTTSDFPFVLPDAAYRQFFALPGVSKALELIAQPEEK